MPAIRISLLLTLALLVLIVGTSQGADSPKPLFSPAAAPDGAPSAASEGALRRRYVEVDMASLGTAAGQGVVEGKTLQIDLFGSATYTAVADQVESPAAGQLIWQGQLQGQTMGKVTIVARDGVAAGSIWADGHLYRLQHVGEGIHALEELPAAEPTAEHPPIPVDPDLVQASSRDGGQTVSGDDGSIIDVMVVYTPASRNRYGGRSGIEALIDLAVAETNEAYYRSAINTRISLVAAVEVSYQESGSMVEDLYRLQRTDDGYLDAIHNWRDTYAADTVSMIQESSDFCGIAFLMTTLSTGFDRYAFSVVDSDCATGYYSFGHELGHNMGSAHDRANGTNAVFPYSYGYWAANYSFRTIMAYNCPGGCVRVQRFSNPNVYYNGLPTGISYSSNPNAAADNARSINGASYTVANWRDGSNHGPAAPTGLTAVAQSPTRIALSWRDNASGELGYHVQRRIPGYSWAQIAVLPSNTTSYIDQGRSADTTYEYRVRSYDSSETSAFSNVASATTPRYPELHIGSMSGGGAVESGSVQEGYIWGAWVTVEVHDAYHDPVSGARVNGEWSGGIIESGSCLTSSSGRCYVVRSGLSPAIDNVTFSVTGIVYNGDPYQPDHNHGLDGTGFSVTINRPVAAVYLPSIQGD